MSDWIDELFEQVERADDVSERARDHLLRLLDECPFPDNVALEYEAEILSSDLDRVRYGELRTTFEMNVLDIRYQYAPRQRDITDWIKQICEL